jgi:electron transfer flavoprotein beta subunit
MRVLTVVSQTLDAEEAVRLRDSAVDLSSSKLVVDAMDEYSVEEALRLREAGTEAEIIAVGVGPSSMQEALRTALAIGADRAIHVSIETSVDPLAVGSIVAAIAREESAELVFAGGQQSSWDSQAIGSVIAEKMGWPQVTWVSKLQLTGTTLTGTHDVDNGTETFEVNLPAVITTQQGLNEPRYPTLPNIMKSRKKELRTEPAERFSASATVRTDSASLQLKERLHKILDGKDAVAAATQLVEFLKNEAKVIA